MIFVLIFNVNILKRAIKTFDYIVWNEGDYYVSQLFRCFFDYQSSQKRFEQT